MAASLTAKKPAGLCSHPSSVLPSKICLHLGHSENDPGGPGSSTAPLSGVVVPASGVGSVDPPEPPVALEPPVLTLPPVAVAPPVAVEPPLPPVSPEPPVASSPPVPPTVVFI